MPEGAGEQIGIDAVRAVADFIVRTPQIAPRKVAVITNADALNPHAANALLKTLEEPPADSYLILVSDSLRDLLPTLRSRCRLVAVRPPPTALALAWIREQMPAASSERIAALCFEYGGAPYRVIAALERDEQPIAETLCAVARGEANALNVAEGWARTCRLNWSSAGCDISHACLGCDAFRVARTTIRIRSRTCSTRRPTCQLLSMWDQLARDRLLLRGTTNPNARLLFESRLLAWKDLAVATVISVTFAAIDNPD